MNRVKSLLNILRGGSGIFLSRGCTTKEWHNWLVTSTNFKREYEEEGFWLGNNIMWTAENTYQMIQQNFCRIPVVLESCRSLQGWCTPPAPSSRSTPDALHVAGIQLWTQARYSCAWYSRLTISTTNLSKQTDTKREFSKPVCKGQTCRAYMYVHTHLKFQWQQSPNISVLGLKHYGLLKWVSVSLFPSRFLTLYLLQMWRNQDQDEIVWIETLLLFAGRNLPLVRWIQEQQLFVLLEHWTMSCKKEN